MAVGAEELRARFTHHAVSQQQADRMKQIREACLDLALLIDAYVPDSREKSIALTNLEDVMTQANSGIARR